MHCESQMGLKRVHNKKEKKKKMIQVWEIQGSP